MAEQNAQNHGRFVPLFHFVTFGLLVVNLFSSLHGLWPLNKIGFHAFLLAVALVLLAWFTRAFPVGVQDRVIRLEERIRVRDLAPAQAARFDALPIAQVIALRFASDAEFPALLQQVLDGKLTAPKDIKAAVKNWRADDQRI
jgi:hypothetical protein